MSEPELLEDLLARYRELKDALLRASTQSESNQLIGAITELDRDLRDLEGRIGKLRSKLRTLIERSRWLSDDTSSITVPGVAPEGAPLHSDKLGASTYRQKGWDCIASGDFEDAKQHLTRALELAPDDIEALSTLGWAQAMAHDYDDALMTYQRVLASNPQDEQARVNLGYICLKKKIYGEAVEHLTSAIRAGQDRKATLYGNYYLGLVYLAREMYQDAEAYFQLTIELGPAMSEAYFQLGRTRYLAGRKADAVSAWREGLAANAYSPWGIRCRDAARAVEAGEEPLLD